MRSCHRDPGDRPVFWGGCGRLALSPRVCTTAPLVEGRCTIENTVITAAPDLTRTRWDSAWLLGTQAQPRVCCRCPVCPRTPLAKVRRCLFAIAWWCLRALAG